MVRACAMVWCSLYATDFSRDKNHKIAVISGIIWARLPSTISRGSYGSKPGTGPIFNLINGKFNCVNTLNYNIVQCPLAITAQLNMLGMQYMHFAYM